MMKTPAISVIMSVRNMKLFVSTAINSILRQTFNDFEFIVIDDASTDGTQTILEEIHDSRIIRINNTFRMGAYNCRNKGIDIAKGKYICIMDGDDISHPNRLMKQFEFMESNHQYMASGSDVEIFSTQISPISLLKLRKPEQIKVSLLEENTSVHSTMIFRQEIFKHHNIKYNTEYYYYGDYDLMVNISHIGNLSNIAEPLLQHRKHENQMTTSSYPERMMEMNQIRLKQLYSFKVKPSIDEVMLHLYLMSGCQIPESKLTTVEKWCNKLLLKNHQLNIYHQNYLFHFFEKRIIEALKKKSDFDLSKPQISNLNQEKKKWFHSSSNVTLTSKECDFLKQWLLHGHYYLEYGCGLSTKLANDFSNIEKIVSVESDKEYWKNEIASCASIKRAIKENRIIPQFIDIGKTGKWGYPINEEKKYKWPTYSSIPYILDINYDLILVDGRFRIACVLEACLKTGSQTKIMIHDYYNRPYYSVIESFLEEIDRVDRMGLFSIKPDNNHRLMKILLDEYKYLPEY